jgi:hypothetical protein
MKQKEECQIQTLTVLAVVVTTTAILIWRVATDVFLGVCFEGFFASWSAEIIVFAVVDCFVLCSLIINFHIAYQIFSHTFLTSIA